MSHPPHSHKYHIEEQLKVCLGKPCSTTVGPHDLPHQSQIPRPGFHPLQNPAAADLLWAELCTPQILMLKPPPQDLRVIVFGGKGLERDN